MTRYPTTKKMACLLYDFYIAKTKDDDCEQQGYHFPDWKNSNFSRQIWSKEIERMHKICQHRF